jgi:hypothetical protein
MTFAMKKYSIIRFVYNVSGPICVCTSNLMLRAKTTPSGRIVTAGERRNKKGRKNKMGLCQALAKFGTLALLSPGWIISIGLNFKVKSILIQ